MTLNSKQSTLTLGGLVDAIRQAHADMLGQAARAVNTTLTVRNWLIGGYIHTFELKGADKARYGMRLFETIATRLKKNNVPRTSERELRRYRHFYLAYPRIRESLTPEFMARLPFPVLHTQMHRIRETLSPESATAPQTLLKQLSFSHFAEILQLEDNTKRTFYENECIRGNWSVRELKRQIATLFYERSVLSSNKTKLSAITHKSAETASAALTVRDPYVFEFLGIKPQEVMGESDLEDALLDQMQRFLLELGHGFCFEARQKRIVIGGEYFFVDLVFYHRVLKCHVLIDLKVDDFKHEYLGQLNTYVNWYAKTQKTDGDNQPIGILLCTRKNHALVEFALAEMNNNLFVSKYLMELPKKDDVRRFLELQLAEQPARLSLKASRIYKQSRKATPRGKEEITKYKR